MGERNDRKRQGRLRLRVARGRMRTDRGRLMTYKHTYIHTYIHTNKIAIEFTSTGSLRSPNKHTYILGECKAFVGERNERKRQGRLRLRVAQGRMRTDRGRLMTY